jgi:hypothetical protein
MQKSYPAGQVGLLLLLIVGVVVAIVMSIASRSLSDTVLSRQERESSAAFLVAETGVENALNSLRLGNVPSQTSFTDSAGLVSGSFKVDSVSTYALYLKELETAQLDLSTAGPNLTISWTMTNDKSENPVTCTDGSGSAPAAIEVTAINGSTVSRNYYNPHCSVSSLAGNGFSDSSAGTSPYLSTIAYAVPAGSTILRIKPIYSGATISVTGTGLSTQLFVIKSRAIGGDAQKEIEVKRGLDAPPSIFDFAVFSNGTIM